MKCLNVWVCISCSILIFPLTAAADPTISIFPGKQSVVWEPRKNYALQCLSTKRNPLCNSLFLLKKGSKIKKAIYLPSNGGNNFDRSIEFFWNKCGNIFVINDFSQGPGQVNCYLFQVEDPDHPIDVLKTVKELMTPDELKIFSGDLPTGIMLVAKGWHGNCLQFDIHADYTSSYLWDTKRLLTKIR